jgi:hypothetical protein
MRLAACSAAGLGAAAPPRSPHAPNAATRWLLVGAALVAAAGWLAFKPGMLPTGGNTDSPAADAPTDASKAATLVGPQGAAGTVATPDQPMAAAVTAAPGTPPASSGAAVPTTPASTAPATPAPAVAANPPPAARPAATAPWSPPHRRPLLRSRPCRPPVSGPVALPPSPSPSPSPAAPRPAPKDTPTLNDLLD